jgi:hypothetical protein
MAVPSDPSVESKHLLIPLVAQIKTSLEQMRRVASEEGTVEQSGYVGRLVREIEVQVDNLAEGTNSPPDWLAPRTNVQLSRLLAMKLQVLIQSIRKVLGADMLGQGAPCDLVANALASVYTLEFEIEDQFPDLADDDSETDDH